MGAECADLLGVLHKAITVSYLTFDDPFNKCTVQEMTCHWA